eukprot:CAMPEP_0185749900 /NCGR_PEP_ID=MMETSP1174-20130828/8611_1 /TAXON_ID=35687 /ORGANISM="Dictyocha speculum, Strain CCMP1381" /LENGTH=37 /DNA_ID= /DNA_START= /DNA_END= /DNA_ORIENTATION=
MFGTTLSYVALRLLGLASDHPRMLIGREFIKGQGGIL